MFIITSFYYLLKIKEILNTFLNPIFLLLMQSRNYNHLQKYFKLDLQQT